MTILRALFRAIDRRLASPEWTWEYASWSATDSRSGGASPVAARPGHNSR